MKQQEIQQPGLSLDVAAVYKKLTEAGKILKQFEEKIEVIAIKLDTITSASIESDSSSIISEIPGVSIEEKKASALAAINDLETEKELFVSLIRIAGLRYSQYQKLSKAPFSTSNQAKLADIQMSLEILLAFFMKTEQLEEKQEVNNAKEKSKIDSINNKIEEECLTNLLLMAKRKNFGNDNSKNFLFLSVNNDCYYPSEIKIEENSEIEKAIKNRLLDIQLFVITDNYLPQSGRYPEIVSARSDICPEVLLARWKVGAQLLVDASKEKDNQYFVKELLAEFPKRVLDIDFQNNIFSHTFEEHKARRDALRDAISVSLEYANTKYRSADRIKICTDLKTAIAGDHVTATMIVEEINKAQKKISSEYTIFSPQRSLLFRDLKACSEIVTQKIAGVTLEQEQEKQLLAKIKEIFNNVEHAKGSRWNEFRTSIANAKSVNELKIQMNTGRRAAEHHTWFKSRFLDDVRDAEVILEAAYKPKN